MKPVTAVGRTIAVRFIVVARVDPGVEVEAGYHLPIDIGIDIRVYSYMRGVATIEEGICTTKR